MPGRWSGGVERVGRGLTVPPQRFLGWLFDRVWVDGGRYGCYNQQPYLTEYASARDRSTGFDWTLYQVMLSDRARIEPYRRDIEATVPGRTVLEIGPGPTAILTRLALDAGASRVISVEGSPWVAAEARRRLQKDGVPESRASVVTAFSDDLTAAHTGGLVHFDVLLLETYHAIASQERVIETIATLRDNGFTFDRVISRGFSTYVAPSRAPRAGDLTAFERVLMRWPARARHADEAMRSRSSSLHGDVARIESLRLADGKLWQTCDFEGGGDPVTLAELDFEVDDLSEYAGLLFWNDFWFHDETLDTWATPTCWGVFYVPLGISAANGLGPATVRVETEQTEPGQPSAVRLRATANGGASAPLLL